MKFELNYKEQELSKKFYESCKYLLDGKDVNVYYTFIPTGIGCGIKVGCKELGIEKDITDYDAW